MNSGIVSLETKKTLIAERGMLMSARIEFRKCTICHESFGWNGVTRCICNECKKQNASGSAIKKSNNDLFVAIRHASKMRAIV